MFEGEMKRIILLIGILWASTSYGQSNSVNLSMPQSQSNYQSDRIRAGDLECSMAIGSSTNLEFGVVGIVNQNDPTYDLATQDPNFNYYPEEFIRDVGVYGRITIPLNAPKKRLDCDRLYQLELRKKLLEVEKLEAELANLRAMQFEQ
jgi:hypothetical protein